MSTYIGYNIVYTDLGPVIYCHRPLFWSFERSLRLDCILSHYYYIPSLLVHGPTLLRFNIYDDRIVCL